MKQIGIQMLKFMLTIQIPEQTSKQSIKFIKTKKKYL